MLMIFHASIADIPTHLPLNLPHRGRRNSAIDDSSVAVRNLGNVPTSPEPLHVGSSAPEAVADLNPAVSYSGSAVDTMDNSQEEHTADPSGAA